MLFLYACIKFDNKIIEKRSESTETILLSIHHILKRKIRASGQTVCNMFFLWSCFISALIPIQVSWELKKYILAICNVIAGFKWTLPASNEFSARRWSCGYSAAAITSAKEDQITGL